MENINSITENLKYQIKFIGDDPYREGLIDTPKRIIKSWKKLFGGYNQNPKDILTFFKDGVCDEMVILKDIEFYSTCEHHMLPFFGKISIGYIPKDRVVGVSKLARLVEIFSRRLQIQERLTSQIADSIMKHLEAKGVMVICNAQHFCMIARGVEKQNSIMVTSAVRGVFEEVKTRQEFLLLCQNQ
jgi:GTP cyclohydrolase IA